MNYKDYIASDEWKNKANKLKNGGGCFVCGSKQNLHIHHLTYEHIPNEWEGELIVLCAGHHRKVHFSKRGNFFNDGKRITARVRMLRKHFVKIARKKGISILGGWE